MAENAENHDRLNIEGYSRFCWFHAGESKVSEIKFDINGGE